MESSSTPDEELAEREDWFALSAAVLAEAYADDEPEYTLAHIKERNPDFSKDGMQVLESDIDDQVVAEADDDAAWEEPISVRREQTIDLPNPEIAVTGASSAK